MYHRSPKDDFWLLFKQAFVSLRSILETLAVGMFLTADGHMLQYLAIKHFYLLVAHHQFMKFIIRNGIECCVLECFHDEPAGFLLEETLDAEDDAPFERKVFCDILIVLVLVLPDHAFLYEV